MSQREALLRVTSDEFRDLVVSPCKVQEPDQRFGHGAAKTMDARAATELHNMLDFQNQISSSDSGDEAGGPAFRPARRKPPKLQSLRMNLTALSQVYNLYFAAYRNKIWVYRPAGPMAQGLGEKPALVISHTVSSVGAKIPMRPQVKWNGDEANHMIVGFLGDVEILLLCYENGDVTSYYTREIADYIAHRAQHPDSAPRPCPRPFFRANVGISAWGLAIHSKSRLIAVSSNRPEVTVFAFALTHAPAPGRFLTPPHTPAESAVLARKRNWRIVLAPKRSGGNIPNVDFVSSPLGHAQKISAADIHGCIWILDIWRQEIAPAPIVPQDTRWTRTQNRMFWGILALSAGSFLDLGTRRNNSSKEYFSAEATHARAIALGNGNIPIQSSPFKNSRYCIDTTPALDLIQNSELPRRSQSSLLSNPPSPPVLTGSNTSPLTAATLAAASSGNDEDGAAESSDNYDDPPEGDDDSDDDAVASEDQADSGENEPDEGEYDEGDVEVSSWGDDDEDEDEDDDMPLNWAANPTPTNAATTSVITETAPPVLEQYLPNDMTQPPPGQPIVSMFTANQFAHAQELQGLHQVTRVSSLDNRLPQDATERQEEYVDGQPAPRLGMIYDPHKGMTYHEPADDKRWLTWLKRSKDPNILTAEQNQADIAALGEHTSFFVANTADLRLLTTSSRFVDIYCRGPAEPNLSLPVRVCNHRINMTLHVPELNLVVAACQSGRVALVSLIKGSWALPTVCGDRSMRVDKILPTAAEKAKMKKRLKAPLFGIAMGPVQEVEDGTLRLRARKAPASFSCMYRLVLHFKDHTVLSYLVSRPSPEDLRVI